MHFPLSHSTGSDGAEEPSAGGGGTEDETSLVGHDLLRFDSTETVLAAEDDPLPSLASLIRDAQVPAACEF